MAEKTDQNQISNDANKSIEDKPRDLSAGKAHAVKKVPHYLRASSGSCHDACKHGHPHKFKDKPAHPPRKRLSAPLPNGDKEVQLQIYVDKKIGKVVQPKLELPSTSVSPTTTKSNRKVSSSRKSLVLDSSGAIKQKVGSLAESSTPDAPNLIKKVVQSSGKLLLSDTSKITRQEVASAAKRMPLKPNVKREKPLLSTESSMRSSGRKSSETRVTENSRTSRSTSLKTAGSPTSRLVLRTSKVDVKKPLNPATTGIGLKGQNHRSRATTSINGKGNIVEQKELADEKAEEKTLHMIEVKEDERSSTALDAGLLAHFPTPLSPESLNSSSQTTSLSFTSHEVDDQCDSDMVYMDSEEDGSVSNYNNCGNAKAYDNSKEGNKLTLDSEDQHHPESLNLKFRKGNVVSHQSGTNSPRRLRFRQGRTLTDNQGAIGGAQRKSYSKKAADNIKKEEEETGMAKVVLKHQEMEAKKDEQVSLNNVIEETASKLVEKKRSKVKALVGAFETVISLQERKPSAADR